MNREEILGKTLLNMSRLPDKELSDMLLYAEKLLAKIDDRISVKGIMKMASESKSFMFLEEEPEIYSLNDIIKPNDLQR